MLYRVKNERLKMMTNYRIEKRSAFVLTGYGFTIESDFSDYQALAAEKSAFWKGILADGRFDKLKGLAKDGLEWSVNEVYQGKPWNYFAVETEENVEDATRLIEFPASDYVVVSATARKDELFDQLSGLAFGQVLGEIKDYAYVGGPNGTYRKANEDGTFYGEIWIPVVQK
jgi:predicted transcriptional regulator YdeE